MGPNPVLLPKVSKLRRNLAKFKTIFSFFLR